MASNYGQNGEINPIGVAGLEQSCLPKSVFNSVINTLATPLRNYRYEVIFVMNGTEAQDNVKFPALRVSLPKIENKLVERWYKGTKKSFIMNQHRDGTTDIEFQLRQDYDYNVELLNLFGCVKGSDIYCDFKHNEFSECSKIREIYINVIDDTNYKAKDCVTYNLKNPIVENVSFGELSADGTGDVRMTVSIHYDWWDLNPMNN